MTSVAPEPTEKPKPSGRNRGGAVRSSKSFSEDIDEAIAAKMAVLLQPVVTVTMYIPSTAVGAVIGRRGQTIANLQKQAAEKACTGSGSTAQAVRISVVGQDTAESLPYTYTELDFSDTQWTPVVIRADPCAALAAASSIQELVRTNCNETDPSMVIDLPISRHKHATVVGKRGQTLANLSADHGIRIMVPQKDLRHDVIQLEGCLPQIKACLSGVLQAAAKAKPAAKSTSGADDSNAVTVSTVIITQQSPSQTKLRTVSRKTDCSIKKKRLEDGTCQLTITGASQEQVQAAVAILQKWDADYTHSMAAKQAADGGGGGGEIQPQQQTAAATSPSRRNHTRGRTQRNNSNNNNRPKRSGSKNNNKSSSTASDAAATSS